MLTKRGFDAVILITLAFHMAAGIPRMWARRVVREEPGGLKGTFASATLQATS